MYYKCTRVVPQGAFSCSLSAWCVKLKRQVGYVCSSSVVIAVKAIVYYVIQRSETTWESHK